MRKNGVGLVEYDITATPRDFTPAMIVELIDSGIMEIPIFQRNFVWDIKKASRLVESLILGLPVPELFLYSEDDENSKYKIIDGQQRILSIYFFVKGRFPKQNDARISIRNSIADWHDDDFRQSTLADNNTFKDFVLELIDKNGHEETQSNRYEGAQFDTLDSEIKIKFRLRRSLRGVVIRQNKPDDGSSSMFEIFNRLNTGGKQLSDQEVRASLFYCDFYQMLMELNELDSWRKIYGKQDRDLHCEDVELILRAFALYLDSHGYKPTMKEFLNRFSKKSKRFTLEEIAKHKELFISFLDACSSLPDKVFLKGPKIATILDAVFVATCRRLTESPRSIKIDANSLVALKNDTTYLGYLKSGSASSRNMKDRLARAVEVMAFNEE